MKHTTPVYEAPVVLDAGDVVAVTLGTQPFDTADDFSVKSCVLRLDVAARAHPPPPAGPTQHNTSARPLPGDGLKCVRAGIPTEFPVGPWLSLELDCARGLLDHRSSWSLRSSWNSP
ncbi:lasso RiPP family leader peptide-containing protein [Streptomyces sp. NBC_01456]|uniref:lasso RiPP family leader peptide-containing protein n=1 Tax=unclassified Streptomyces TaxID=2593676 RepID=UPI003FCE84F4